MLGTLVALQADRDHVPKDALTKLGQRIQMLGDLYRELYRSGNSEILVTEFLQRICSNLVSSLGRRGVTLDFSGEALTLDRDAAIRLGMIAAELVENSLKHALPDGKGTIAVRLAVAGPQDYILEIKDNGTGRLPVQDSSGTGLQIVKALCQQIGAELTQTHDSGLISRVHVREADKGQPRSAASKAKEAGGVRRMTPMTHKQGVKIALAMAMAASVALIAYDPELPTLEPVPPVPKFDKWPPERWLPFSRKMPKPATAPPESTKRPLYQTEFMFCWELNHKPYFDGCEVDPTVPAIIVSANIRSADTAEALCRSVVDNFTRRASVLHDAGYELRIKSPHTGDKVLAACPM
jgi:two-component sensor histidine kinase